MRLLSTLLLLLGTACASGQPDAVRVPAPRPTTVSGSGSSGDVNLSPSRAVVTAPVRAPPEAAWAALQKVYADLGIEVKETSEASRTLGNPRLVISRQMAGAPLSRYLECGRGLQGPAADRYRIEMSIRSTVAPAGEGEVQVDTYVEAQARNPEGSSNSAVTCASTQRLEREIAARVRTYAAGA